MNLLKYQLTLIDLDETFPNIISSDKGGRCWVLFLPSRFQDVVEERPLPLLLPGSSPVSVISVYSYRLLKTGMSMLDPAFVVMADTQSVATLIDSTTSKLQQLQHAFSELESHSAISLNLKWKELEQHFHGLEQSLKKRFGELEDEEMEYVRKVSETQEMLEKREAVVVAKEQASLERLQEKRDAVLSALFEKYRNSSAALANQGVSNNYLESSVEDVSDITVVKSDVEDEAAVESRDLGEKPTSKLEELCEKMDVEGLHKFISDNRKNLASIREEIPVALRAASNPFGFVLQSLKDFYAGEILGFDGKKDAGLLGLRRTCLMLMESLSSLTLDSDSLSEKQRLTADIREQAIAVSKYWKPKLDCLDIYATSGNSLEAHAFLQLLATFGISSEFDEDEICKLIPAVSRRRQAADLCRSLGFLQKIPGLIEALINNGRQLDAVNLAFALELTEKFAPVPLLKSYIKEVRKVSQSKVGNMTPAGQQAAIFSFQNEMNERELTALKAVIKCIEEHKLEEQYPVDPLQKRVLQLEKAKADKRRAVEAAKPQSKRPRASATTYAPRSTPYPEKSFYRTPERYPYPYDRQYMYPPEAHPLPPPPSVLGSAAYTISPTHTTYYGNGYSVQYPPTAYLH
ncbi:Protein FRIGIDA [Apostasia shenzhenica]|uniref:FRIGIDA-like protein n=1 Tax=Apostasia shenzhenica TaxID=1088818 RepID=A0A2I0BFY5_9ASPA|nr:Protein FRIGIDA [Apostasia shenzhenica]